MCTGNTGRVLAWTHTYCEADNGEFPVLPRSIPVTHIDRTGVTPYREDTLALDLFAGIPVTDYATALPWYEQFFGRQPSFLPNDIEAVWEVAEHRYIYIVQKPERAGSALVLSFVDDLDDRVAEVAQRGIEPAKRETYEGGVTKVTYRDADGNEISFGGGPG